MTEQADLHTIRALIRAHYLADESRIVNGLIKSLNLSPNERTRAAARAEALVRTGRSSSASTLMECFLVVVKRGHRLDVSGRCFAPRT